MLVLALVSCGRAEDPPAEIPAADAARARYAAAVTRMLTGFTELGQVVSRDPDTWEPRHLGDSALWSWTAIGVLGCGEGYQTMQLAAARLRAKDGYLLRYLPLPDEYAGGNETSLDPEIGYWFGTASRWRRCPDDRAELAEAWVLHEQAIDKAGGHLHPNVAAMVPVGLDAVRDAVGAAMGLGEAPGAARIEFLGAELAAWVKATLIARQPCYRLNLAWTAIRALEEAGGGLTAGGRDAFCAASAGAGIATVDHWCGRGGLGGFVDSFQPNVWESALQRCPAWEFPDGAPYETPGLDLIVAMRELYGSSLEESTNSRSVSINASKN